MAEIMRAPSPQFLGPEFNDFLFATIGADRDGGYVSVVSVLARLDLDPWAEAAKLAKLPVDIATQKLSLLIAALQEIPLASQEPRKIAVRLVALLPGTLNVKIRPTMSAFGNTAITKPRSAYAMLLFAFGLMLTIQFIVHSAQPLPHPVAHIASTATSSNNSASTQVAHH